MVKWSQEELSYALHNSKILTTGLNGLSYVARSMRIISPTLDIGIGAYKVGDAYMHGGDTAKVALETGFEIVGGTIGGGLGTSIGGPWVGFFGTAGGGAIGKVVAGLINDNLLIKH